MADFIRPSPNDLISDGADAISTNADAAADTLGLHAGRLTNLETATGDLAGAVSDLNLRTTDVETAINHALPIVGPGRPDIPATTPYSSAQLAAMPSGTVYRSTDGPQGAWEWQKQGATWKVTNGDTGPRDITDSISTSLQPVTGSILVTRSGSIVTLELTDITFTGSGWSTVVDLPYPYRPAAGTVALGAAFTGTGQSILDGVTSIRATTALSLNVVDGRMHRATFSYSVTRDWPTSLPGTAA